MTDSYDKLQSGPLSEHEIQNLRQLALDLDRAKWFRRQLKIWGAWLVAAPVAIVAAWQASHSIMEFISKMIGKAP